MTKASSQVQVKESAARPDIFSSDVFDTDDGGDGRERVLDMMATGQSSAQRIQHLEVISEREFPYQTLTTRATDKDGKTFDFENPGRSPAMEAFMEEAVVIEIHETTDEKAPPLVFVGINGDQRWLPRGVPIRLPRKFVERLAQSAERTYTTPTTGVKEGTDNERPVKQKSTQAYPFAILEDSHRDKKLARKWLKRVTKQGT